MDEKNIETLLTILKNLNPELITKLEVNGKSSNAINTQYKPKTNAIIKEQDSGVNDSSGKYINPTAYKNRLKKK
ncbi:hypothetical protein [Sulfurimonas sp.]|uniref:hypothetical protein n=1 Tax=Sulfurimonas sp. TaxID=2022749 RepID=UPI0025EEF124|nr:hypothetical protein [Sulfurimonas sp.]